MKTRKNVRDNYSYSLLLCVEEARERGDFHKILGVMNLKEYDVLDLENAFEFCQKIGLAIESAMFAKYEQQIVRTSFFLINCIGQRL